MTDFNSKLELITCDYVSNDIYELTCKASDNSGRFFASDCMINDIVYFDDDDSVKRYIVTKVINASQSNFIIEVKWDMPGVEPDEPYYGYDGVIGRRSGNLGLTSLPSWNANLISESFITNIKNYEQRLIDRLFATPTKCDGETDSFIAAVDIEQYRVLFLQEDGRVNIADAGDLDSFEHIIGISLTAANAGESVSVLIEGTVEKDGWDFGKSGETIFIGRNGEPSIVPVPDGKYVQQIGLSTKRNVLNLELGDCILI